MPSYCIICEFKWQKEPDTSFHKFSFDRKDILAKWIDFVRTTKNQPDWKPSRWSSLCNKHFLPSDFKVQKGVLRKHLKPDAVPSILREERVPTVAEPQAISTIPALADHVSLPSDLPLDAECTGTQCRLCFQTISATSGGGMTLLSCPILLDWITKFLRHLNILPDDCFTKSVCTECFQKLEEFNRFSDAAMLCQNSLLSSISASFVNTSYNDHDHNYNYNHLMLSSRTSADHSRAVKIKQEPIPAIKEENHVLNSSSSAETRNENSTDFDNNFHSLLSDFYHYDLSNGHILEITDLSNEFINLTGEEDDVNSVANPSIPLVDEMNVKPNPFYSQGCEGLSGGGVHLKLEEGGGVGGVIDDLCDEDDLTKQAMISNEHSYCKFNLPHLFEGNILRMIKTEKKEDQKPMVTIATNVLASEIPVSPSPAHPIPTTTTTTPPTTVPKIYIIDNALIKHNDCEIRGNQFETNSTVIGHQKPVQERFLCLHCNTRFPNFSGLYFHKLNCSYRRGYAMVPGKKYWNCSKCSGQFKLLLGLKNHQQRNVCQKLLRLRSGREKCTQATELDRERQMDINSKTTGIGDKNQQFACELCPKSFVRRSNLNQHKLTHSAERQFVCDLCEKRFKRLCGLAAHRKSFHLKMRPFSCPECGRGFALKSDMKRCRHQNRKREETEGQGTKPEINSME